MIVMIVFVEMDLVVVDNEVEMDRGTETVRGGRGNEGDNGGGSGEGSEYDDDEKDTHSLSLVFACGTMASNETLCCSPVNAIIAPLGQLIRDLITL